MSNYSSFAIFYDELTSNVDYNAICDYLLQLLKKKNHQPGLTLDLACGTGSLTCTLIEKGVDAFGVDYSIEMLSQAKDKAYDKGLEQTLFLYQKMQELDLYGSVDTVFCMLDSLNHLKFDDIKRTFERIHLFLNNGGYFIFDMNTIYKHIEVLGNNTFIYDEKNVYCIWQNFLDEVDQARIDILLTFFEKKGNNYKRSDESFSEFAYRESVIIDELKKAGFVDIETFAELSFEKPVEDTERIIYVAKKM